MKRAFLPLLALFLLHGAVAAEGFDFDAEKKRLLEQLADGHCDLGKQYKGKLLYTDARAHYNRALLLVDQFADAMKGLGFEKSGGTWKEVEKNKMPEKNGVSGAEETKVRKELEAKRDSIYARLAAKIKDVAKRAKAGGKDLEANILLSYVPFYAPDDKEFREGRGHVKVGEDWMPSWAKLAAEHGADVLKAASEGEIDPAEDPQAKEIGVKFYVRKGKHVIARATESDERVKRLHKVIEGTITLSAELLVSERKPFNGTQLFTVLQTREQYLAMVDKFSGKSGADLELARKLSGCNQQKPWGFFCFQPLWPGGDDMHSNTVAINMLAGYRRSGDSEPWIDTGFSYLITARLLGTTNTIRYTVQDVGDTAVKGQDDLNMNKTSGGPAKLRQVALELAQSVKDTPLVTLAGTALNALKLQQAAKSFSFMEFIFQKYPEEARKWLAMIPGKGVAEIANLEKAFSKTATELDKEWREWVLVTY
ncbi:hypothetical protein PLCT1_01543 [Planctomycetaceae bacterium]|nr:hypothetical protein PLCT1_01543 [Planctomycetaceae bacterium]